MAALADTAVQGAGLVAILELDLALRVPAGEEGRAAEAILAQLPPAAKAAFVALAAAVVTLAERESESRVLVLPAGWEGMIRLP